MIKKENKETDLKEQLRKEEVKDRFTNLAFDLFSKGADDETVMREISVFIPNIDAKLIQRLRNQWQSKQDVDKEIKTIDRGEKAPEKIEKPKPAPEIKPTVDEPPVELPVKPPVTEGKPDELLDAVEKDAKHEGKVEKPVTPPSGEVPPAPSPPTQPPIAEGKPIEKPPTPSLRDEVDAAQYHAEIVRATEELRRAITSEIRAQESYERARLELANAKRELNVVRSELDEFKHDVDMLKLKERVVERETVKPPKLETDTEKGKRLEEEVSTQPFKRVVEDIVEKKIKEREAKEPIPTKEPVPAVPVEKKDEVPEVGKEIQNEIDKEEKKQQELDTWVKEQTAAAKSFYDKLMAHLDVYKYLVVRLGKNNEPEVYKQNLTSRGVIIGVSVGIPSGFGICYVILTLAGML